MQCQFDHFTFVRLKKCAIDSTQWYDILIRKVKCVISFVSSVNSFSRSQSWPYFVTRRSEFLSLLDGVPGIARALDAGGWICGGFVRHLLLDLPIADYFTPKEDGRAGDVDIFFSNQDDANRAAGVAALKGNGCDNIQTSWGGFAKEMTARFNRRSVTIQFVNHPDKIKPTVEETLDGFDFLNCKVAISREGLVIAEGWREVESLRLLKICSASSPFLGSRITKYLTKKGLNELTEDSQPLVTEWLLSASLKEFEGSETKHGSYS